MKIVFLSDDFPPQSFGGAGISTYELAAGMKAAGHEVFVITTCRGEHDAGEQSYHGLKVFKIATGYPDRWRAYVSLYNRSVVRRIEGFLKGIRPEVVHVNNVHFYLSYHCLKIAQQHAKVVVFTARDTMAFTYGKLETARYLNTFDCRTTWYDNLRQARVRWNPFRNYFIRKYLTCADALFAVSESLQEALQQNGIQNVKVLHTGIDTAEWHVSRQSAARFKARHHLEGKRVIFIGGRLGEAKGGRTAIEALALVVREIPSAVLVVAGSVDWYAEQMKEEAKRWGVEDKVVFVGWLERDEIKNAYAAADVVLVPSLYLDPFPRAVLEAMASKKPVVGTCYGGAPEAIVDGETGYIVDPRYPEKIAEKILDLLNNPAQAEAFGRSGRERMWKSFNLKDTVKGYERVYEAALTGTA